MNPTGIVPVEAGGKRYELRYTVGALCAIEDRLKMTTGDAMAKLGAMNIRTLRTLFAGGLTPVVTEAEAGLLMDDLGLKQVGVLVGEALKAAFPEATGEASDPQDQDGTGNTS